MTVFHLALPIKDKAETKAFYSDLLGCVQGREADTWVDFDFFGHQLSFHVKPDAFGAAIATNQVDGKAVPVQHHGAILDWDMWQTLSERLVAEGIEFVIEPHIRFKGKTGEQATMFFLDPSGHALEFKAFKDPSQIFAV